MNADSRAKMLELQKAAQAKAVVKSLVTPPAPAVAVVGSGGAGTASKYGASVDNVIRDTAAVLSVLKAAKNSPPVGVVPDRSADSTDWSKAVLPDSEITQLARGASGMVDLPAKKELPQMPNIADCTGDEILQGVVSNLARQLEYYKKLSKYWETAYKEK